MLQPSPLRLQLAGLLRGHPWRIQHLCFSPDGNMLASTSISVPLLPEGAAGPTVFLWDVSRQQLFTTVEPPIPFVSAVTFSPDGTLLAVAGEEVFLWDCTVRQFAATLPGPAQYIAFSRDGQVLFVVDPQGMVRLWHLATKEIIYSFRGIPEQASSGCLTVAPDDSCLALTSSTRETFVWLLDSTLRDAVLFTTLDVGYYSGILFSPDARSVASLTRNKKVRRLKPSLKPPKDDYSVVRLYALQSFSPIGDLPLRDLVSGGFVSSESSQSMSFSPDGSFLALGESDGKLFVWNVNTQQLVVSMQAHPYFEGALPYNSIEAVNWSKRGNLLATGGRDPTDAVTYGEEFVIKLWDVSTLHEN